MVVTGVNKCFEIGVFFHSKPGYHLYVAVWQGIFLLPIRAQVLVLVLVVMHRVVDRPLLKGQVALHRLWFPFAATIDQLREVGIAVPIPAA